MSKITPSRYAGQISFSFLIWMVIFAVLVSAGGITYCHFKHEQVGIRNDIDTLKREIAECNMNANQYRAKTNELMNCWAMRDRLNRDHSSLRDITREQIEIARRDHSRLTYAR